MRRASYYLRGHMRASVVQRVLDITASIGLGVLIAWLAAEGF